MVNAAQWFSAVIVASVVLVVAVLPAEYGIDPTGLGQVFGLTALANEQQQPVGALADHLNDPALAQQPTPALHRETLRFELGPFESVEYKYRLRAGDSLQYRWLSNHEVLVNFHSEPDATTPNSSGETAVSFNQGRSHTNYGAYVAPFDGIHGWFWQNRGSEPVVLELQSSGFFKTAIDYRGGFPFHKTIQPDARAISE